MELWITGAGGRIGTILRRHWLGKHTIVGLDIRPYDHPESEEAYVVDIGNTEFLTALTNRGKSSGLAIIHLAAEASDRPPWPALLRTNIQGTYNVFTVAKEFGARRVIFASSNHVTGGYGDVAPGSKTDTYTPPPSMITPDMPLRPDSPYGASKAFGEVWGRYVSDRFLLSVICLRIGSVTDRNDPTENPRLRSTWLSHRDLCHLFDCCLTADIRFGIYYGVSSNIKRFWSISNAEQDLGYHPQDNAELCYTEKGETHAHPS